MEAHEEQIIKGHDVGIIRPKLVIENVKLRGQNMPRKNLKAIMKALRAFHTLETMAVNIYKFQLTKHKNELNRQLAAAMCNEMTHLQDFQLKLYEFGFTPSKLRSAYWIVGLFFGFCSRVLGRSAMLRTGIWVETKAVDHYAHLLDEIDWDEDSRRMIEKNAADEEGHITRWRKLLGTGNAN